MAVKTNSEDILKVAKAIDASCKDIDAAIQRMDRALSSAVWDDRVRKSFEQDFAAMKKNLKNFKSQADSTVKYLKRKGGKLGDYETGA